MAKHSSDPRLIPLRKPNGDPILTWEDWEAVYEQNQGHFVPNRSAYSIAQFMLEQGGDKYLSARVSQLLPEPVVFQHAIPELEIRFDSYGKGRFHDLGIYGEGHDSGKSLFVGVEAKVDEPFGEVVKDVYARAMARRGAGVSTNLPDRVDDLLALHFPAKPPRMWETRYQLLYATAGTLAARMDMSVLYIIVFRTSAYDPEIGKENERDFMDFMKQTGATDLKGDGNARAYKMTLGGKDLYCVYDYFDLK
jgi:hypothetical protein